jgi:hypothetical protein
MKLNGMLGIAQQRQPSRRNDTYSKQDFSFGGVMEGSIHQDAATKLQAVVKQSSAFVISGSDHSSADVTITNKADDGASTGGDSAAASGSADIADDEVEVEGGLEPRVEATRRRFWQVSVSPSCAPVVTAFQTHSLSPKEAAERRRQWQMVPPEMSADEAFARQLQDEETKQRELLDEEMARRLHQEGGGPSVVPGTVAVVASAPALPTEEDANEAALAIAIYTKADKRATTVYELLTG